MSLITTPITNSPETLVEIVPSELTKVESTLQGFKVSQDFSEHIINLLEDNIFVLGAGDLLAKQQVFSTPIATAMENYNFNEDRQPVDSVHRLDFSKLLEKLDTDIPENKQKSAWDIYIDVMNFAFAHHRSEISRHKDGEINLANTGGKIHARPVDDIIAFLRKNPFPGSENIDPKSFSESLKQMVNDFIDRNITDRNTKATGSLAVGSSW